MRYRAVVGKEGDERYIVAAVLEGTDLKVLSEVVGLWLTTMAEDFEITLTRTGEADHA